MLHFQKLGHDLFFFVFCGYFFFFFVFVNKTLQHNPGSCLSPNLPPESLLLHSMPSSCRGLRHALISPTFYRLGIPPHLSLRMWALSPAFLCSDAGQTPFSLCTWHRSSVLCRLWPSGSQTWCASVSPGGLVQIQIAGLYPRVSDSIGLGWGPIVCISSKFRGDAAAAETSLLRLQFESHYLFPPFTWVETTQPTELTAREVSWLLTWSTSTPLTIKDPQLVFAESFLVSTSDGICWAEPKYIRS